MSTQSPLPQNDPMLIAFQKLKHTPEYKNAVNWTIKAENESQADGELWFGFAAGWNAHASHTAAIREKAEALVAVNPVSVYRDKIVEYICEDDFDFTKILEEVEHEGEKYCDISQDGAFALVDYFLNLMEKVNEWRSEDAGQNYDFLHGKAELEKGNG